MYNVFEAVDVITLIKGGVYDDLSLTVGEALKKRSPVCLASLLLFLWSKLTLAVSRTSRVSTHAL